MREYSATAGATEGNIIAAIITTQTPANQPSVPRPVQGPSSIPLMRSLVHHQLIAASASSAAMRPRRARVAASAGARPAAAGARSCAAVITASGGPGELRRGESGLALVLDAERVDLRALRLRHRQVGPGGVEHVLERDRGAVLDAERDDVLDLERDRVAHANAVPEPVVRQLDRRTLDTQYLADERAECSHRSAELAAEDARQLLELCVARLVVDEHPDPPV